MNKVSFNDIVESLKQDVNQNIYELCHNLKCSDGVIYRRLIKERYRGLSVLKGAIREGTL
jgi:hypothetical protein